MAFDGELGWRPLPNVKKVGDVWGVSRPATTNSHGWRDIEHSYDKPPGMHRAIAIGDSFTFGTNVDDGERFTDLLPHRIDHLEVINLGVPGYGTDQELRLLETEGIRYKPDVVILTICVLNDLGDILHERLYSFPKPYYTLENNHLRLWKPKPTWDIGPRASSYLVEFLYQRLMNQNIKSHRAEGLTSTDAMPIFEALVRQIATVTEQHGARMVAVLAYGPEGVRGDFTELGKQITATLDRIGVPNLDTRKLFAARSPAPNRFLFSSIGNHWNAQGHVIVTDGIQQLLTQVGPR